MKFVRKSIQEVVQYLNEDLNLSYPHISNILGVTELMCIHYKKGRHKSPKNKVCKRVWDRVEIKGCKVLIDTFNSPEDLMKSIEMEM